MTYEEISQMIASVGLPFAYDHFSEKEKPAGPPFICFLYSGSDNFAADGIVYQPISVLAVELYTDDKSFEYEAAVEAALTASGLFFNKDETWIESERMFEVIYTAEVDITEAEADSGETTGETEEEPNGQE